ncbi:RimK family alpha-L-glutamate ligase [Candidatus Woesebacteria bacterium]|nr:RimK family alpha-L-glutamate ligase [Candidatus Woesebacteria bacterium]
MNILIAGLKTKRQFLRLKEEGEKRGHKVSGCLASDLRILASKDLFKPLLRGLNIEEFDLIYLIVGKRLWEWYTVALHLNEKLGTIIINSKAIDPESNFYLGPAIDYLKQAENNIPFPKSAVLFSNSSIADIMGEFSFPVILKTSLGHRGEGVFKVENLQDLNKFVEETTKGANSCVIREFIPNDGDIRVFCIGYKAIGAMKRTSKEGEFRSNISQGGIGSEFDLVKNPEIKELAEKTVKLMRTEVAGVDIIIDKNTNKPYVLEVNPGPQFDGLETYTETNAALEIIKYFEELFEKNSTPK